MPRPSSRRRGSRACVPRSSRSARRCCSPGPSRRSAIWATASRLRSGGAHRIRSLHRSHSRARALAAAYESGAKKQWTQPIGFAHALFEVAADALKRSKSTAAKDVRDAVIATNLQTVVGPVKWGGQGPFKNVSKTPLVLGQWGKGQRYKMELTIVNNQAAPAIPVGGKMRLMA